MASSNPRRELRVVLTVDDLAEALRLYRDGLGLSTVKEWATPDGSGVILAAGRATLELIDRAHAAVIDQVEVGRRVAGPVRLAFGVQNVDAESESLRHFGAQALHEPVQTPWGDRNRRMAAPDGMQLTLFQPPASGDVAP